MKPLNTFPIEGFLDRARVAIKSNQMSVTMPIKEVIDLQNSLSTVMTRLAGLADQQLVSKSSDQVSISMNGGKF